MNVLNTGTNSNKLTPRINNVFCSEAYLQRKDRLQIGYHFLEFMEDESSSESMSNIPLNERALKSAGRFHPYKK